MSESTAATTTTQDAPSAEQVRYDSLISVHRVWTGDVPEVITGSRALFLAANAQFASLQRMGHKRGKQCTAASVSKVAQARNFTRGQVEDLLFLASRQVGRTASPQAAKTAKWCERFLKDTEPQAQA